MGGQGLWGWKTDKKQSVFDCRSFHFVFRHTHAFPSFKKIRTKSVKKNSFDNFTASLSPISLSSFFPPRTCLSNNAKALAWLSFPVLDVKDKRMQAAGPGKKHLFRLGTEAFHCYMTVSPHPGQGRGGLSRFKCTYPWKTGRPPGAPEELCVCKESCQLTEQKKNCRKNITLDRQERGSKCTKVSKI